MAVSPLTQRQLWARSYNRCAICGQPLVQDSGDSRHTIGEVCHIVAREDSGPRANPSMSDEEKDSYDNLIILCPNHHTLIDKDTTTYTVEKLKKIKSDHENLNICELKPYYEQFITEWDKLCNGREWEVFTNNFLYSTAYHISSHHYKLIDDFISFYRRRPNYFQIFSLDAAFASYTHTLHDFISIFNQHCYNYGNNGFGFRKFYHDYDYPESDKVFKQYDIMTTDLSNLLVEMTRNVNLIIDRIDYNIIPNYSRTHGYVCLDNRGLTLSGYGEIALLRYSIEAASMDKPYQGLDNLRQAIANGERDYWFNSQG